jgi:tetratricopeptide (TPR) repeat protein
VAAGVIVILASAESKSAGETVAPGTAPAESAHNGTHGGDTGGGGGAAAAAAGSSWGSFVRAIGKRVYFFAFPTAKYSHSELEIIRPGADDTTEVVFVVHGLSAFDDSDLWTEVVLAMRGTRAVDLRWGQTNAILTRPGETMKAIGELLQEVNRQSQTPQNQADPSDSRGQTDTTNVQVDQAKKGTHGGDTGGGGAAAAAANTLLFAKGEQALAAGDLPTALFFMEVVLKADPDNLRYASEYRQAVIRAGLYDRALELFGILTVARPDSPNAWLNYGYAAVDKEPAAGAIARVTLANLALQKFTRSIELKPSWLAFYARGSCSLRLPKAPGAGPLAVADLERAVALSKFDPTRAYHAHVYAALGDAYWRTDQTERARTTWEEGARLFPQDAGLKARLTRRGDELEVYIALQLDSAKRVNTDLREMWEEK